MSQCLLNHTVSPSPTKHHTLRVPCPECPQQTEHILLIIPIPQSKRTNILNKRTGRKLYFQMSQHANVPKQPGVYTHSTSGTYTTHRFTVPMTLSKQTDIPTKRNTRNRSYHNRPNRPNQANGIHKSNKRNSHRMSRRSRCPKPQTNRPIFIPKDKSHVANVPSVRPINQPTKYICPECPRCPNHSVI